MKGAKAAVSRLGDAVSFVGQSLVAMVRPPWRWGQFWNQLYFIGNQSLFIILLTGFFTGAVFGLQIGGLFKVFRSEALMGGATGLALAKELAALVTAFLLAGRAGSAMTAEIATMKVSEQIDAMEAMGVDPLHYLVVPRVYASLLMMPLLCGVFMVVGLWGALCTGVWLFQVDVGIFMEKLTILVKPSDVVSGLRKMFVFSFIIAVVSCRYGLRASGAKGVGVATNEAVVKTLLCLLGVDFALSFLEVRWLS
jgi:phospholipid/cholesterol/gamma-HCH transport system permease protein